MNSLREIIESSPSVRQLASTAVVASNEPQPLGAARWKWSDVQRILIVRLRSIGDTVLTTPSLFALRRFVPQAQIHIVLEDWVAPVLEGSDLVDRIITLPPTPARPNPREQCGSELGSRRCWRDRT